MRNLMLALLACSAAAAGAAGRTAQVSNAAGLRLALQSIQPGDSILIEPGEYRGYFALSNHRATADQPTEIAAANPDKPPVLRGTSECLHLTNVSHLVLRDLVLTGARVNGLNIDDGGDYASPSDHVVLDGLTVREIGAGGNHDGIKLSGVDDVLVRGCAIERWGGGGSAIDMVGCHRVLVVDSAFRHRAGKGANAVQAKGGSASVAVYRCRFESAGQRAVNLGGSTGRAYFRPRDAGYEARRIAVLGNVFVGSMAPVAYVGCDQGLVSCNTIYRPTRWALRILQETTGEGIAPCRKGVFRNNLVVWRQGDIDTTVNVGPNTEPQSFRFEGNWWFCEDAPARSKPTLPVAEAGGTAGRDPKLTLDGLRATAPGAPDTGAHAKTAAEEAARILPRLAPWAFERAIALGGGDKASTGKRELDRALDALGGLLP
jgi:hypothetical protein